MCEDIHIPVKIQMLADFNFGDYHIAIPFSMVDFVVRNGFFAPLLKTFC